MNCHTDDFTMANYLRPIQDQFAVSLHNLSDTYVRRGTDASPACSRCHTTEGFQHYVATGNELPLEESSHIGCFACHAPHSNDNFSLRVTQPVAMNHGDEYDMGVSNTCAVCHQSRLTVPPINSPDPITSSRWGPHYGTQANVLSGQGAYAFAGTTYETDAAHNIGNTNGCVTCHMADLPDNVISGGHSFAINYEGSGGVVVNRKGCTCHGWTTDAVATTETNTYQAEFEEELDELGDILVARGWLKADREYATNGATAPVTADQRGAVFNFLLLHHDKSLGVHNKKYAESVVAGTMAWLQANP
jgi:hypothetical protein